MAKQSKVSLASKLGGAGAKAFNESKGKEVRYDSGGDLPPGIEGGVAQLASIKFGTYENGDTKGEYFFMASGIVISPDYVLGDDKTRIPVKGMRTQIGPEPLCDTPRRSRKTVGEHLDWVLNELKKLGVDTSELELDDLEATCEQLVESAPYFRFRTWRGEATKEYPDPRTNHVWQKAIEYNEEEGDGGVEDDTAPEEPEDVEPEVEEPPKASTKKSAPKKATPKKAAPKKPSEEDRLRALGKACDEGDDDSLVELDGLADKFGIDTNEYPTWAGVADAIIAQLNGGEAEPTEEPEADAELPDGIRKGDVYKYKVPKTKKVVETEVIHVYPQKETVNLQNLDTQEKYLNIPFSDLIEA